MSWGVTHRGEFYDGRELIWRIDIELDGGSGAADMSLTGDPLHIEWLAASDDLLFSPIKGSRAKIGVFSESNFQYTSLYSAENFKRRVSIYYVPVTGSTLTVDDTDITVDSDLYTADDVSASAEGTPVLYWRGYLTSDYSEPYNDWPYPVTLTANDGLGLLKDMPYKYTTVTKNDTYYTGRRYESQVILDILGKIGHTSFKEFCNIYEDNIDDGVGDSPFDQIMIDMDVFKDMYCYDVLEQLLKKYNAVIRQINGEFYLYRPTEFDSATVYGRSFTAYDTKSAISCTPEQLIQRSTASDIRDFNGGVLMMVSPLSKFTAQQDYGNKESWIKDHNFDIAGYDVSTGFEDWTMVNFAPLSFFNNFRDETEGIASTRSGTGEVDYAMQYFALEAKKSTNVHVFSFEYLMFKTTSGDASDVGFSISIRDDTYTYYLDQIDNVSAEWDTSPVTVNYTISSVPHGVGNWATYTLSIANGLPADGPYWITLYATNTAGVRIAYRNLRFYETTDTVVRKKKKVSRWKNWLNAIPPLGIIRFFGGGYKNVTSFEVTNNEEVLIDTYDATNAITAPEASANYLLGDTTQAGTGLINTLEQFSGGLAFYETGSLTQTARDFVNDFAATYAVLTSPGVILTSQGNTIYFESDTPGTAFSGSTSIVNASGNLSGTASTVTSNGVGTVKKCTLTLTAGTSGTAFINHSTMTFDTDLHTTCDIWVMANTIEYAAGGITLSVHATNPIITFTGDSGVNFDTPVFMPKAGDLDGDLIVSQAYVAPVARIDKIVLSGSSGTATITCHAEDNVATYNTATILQNTASWHTRGNTEAKPVIELVADEIAAQYAREKHFIQMSLRERGTAAPDVNMLYNLQDSLNTYGGNNRIFMANRGEFNVKRGEWSVDEIEIL